MVVLCKDQVQKFFFAAHVSSKTCSLTFFLLDIFQNCTRELGQRRYCTLCFWITVWRVLADSNETEIQFTQEDVVLRAA